MRIPERNECGGITSDEQAHLRFILSELPDDPEYPGPMKSWAATQVQHLYWWLQSQKEHIKSQAVELQRQERRNLKLQQKITHLIRRIKKLEAPTP